MLMPSPDGGMDTVVLNGALDILVWDPATETWRIYDVKMTKDGQYWRKTQGQLQFYDVTLFPLFGKFSVEAALLQPMCAEQIKVIPTNDQTRSVMLRSMSEMALDVWSGNTEPRKDNKFCTNCEVRHACTKFKPVISSTGKKTISFNINR